MMTPADQYFWANWSDLSRPVWGQLTWDWDGNNNNSNGSQAPVIQMANKCTHEYQHTHMDMEVDPGMLIQKWLDSSLAGQ